MQRNVESQFQKCILAVPDRILVATDLTEIDYLVPHAIAQARVCSAKLTFVHVIASAKSAPSGGTANSCAAHSSLDPAKVIRDARLVLLGVEQQAEAQGIACETRVCQGGVSEAIRREISRTDANRLIIGIQGRGKMGHRALGSVANRLLASIDVPVMVIGPQVCNLADHAAPRRILHPVSLMDIDDSSIQLPLNVAQACRAELTLLHVIDPDLMSCVNPARVSEWADKRLRSMVPVSDLMPAINTRVSFGELAEEILKAADQTQADMILLGSAGCSTWPFSESAACKVLEAASCPVLTYPHEPYRSQIEELQAMHFNRPADPYDHGSIIHESPDSMAHVS